MNITELKQQTAAAFAALEKPETKEIIDFCVIHHRCLVFTDDEKMEAAAAKKLTKLLGLSLPICHMLIANANELSNIAQPIKLPPAPVVPVVIPKPVAPMGNAEASSVVPMTQEADSTTGSTKDGEPTAPPPVT